VYKEETQLATFCDRDSIVADGDSVLCTASDECGFMRKFRRDSTEEKWTSYCSHVHCVSVHWNKANGGLCESGTLPGQIGYKTASNKLSHDCVTQVHHSHAESYGSKHVCKYEMHETGKCGCECYDEGEGFDIFDIEADEDGDQASSFMTSQLTVSAHGSYKRATSTYGFNERICHGGKEFNADGRLCEYTCDDPAPVCDATTVARCQCPDDKPLWDVEVKLCVVDQTMCIANATAMPTKAPTIAPTEAIAAAGDGDGAGDGAAGP